MLSLSNYGELDFRLSDTTLRPAQGDTTKVIKIIAEYSTASLVFGKK